MLSKCGRRVVYVNPSVEADTPVMRRFTSLPRPPAREPVAGPMYADLGPANEYVVAEAEVDVGIESTYPRLGALEVDDNPHRSTGGARGLSDERGSFPPLRARSVREVQPRPVHAGLDHAAKRLPMTARRSNAAQDFRSASHVAQDN